MRFPSRTRAIPLVVITAVAGVGLYLAIAASEAGPDGNLDISNLKTDDERLAEVDQQSSGFGGLFLDPEDNAIAYVYMLDPSQQTEAEKIVRQHVDWYTSSRIREVRVLQAVYSVTQLKEWYDRLWNFAFSVPGLMWSDLNEGKNRLNFGVEDEAAVKAVEGLLDELDVPRDAVIIEISEPFWPLGGALD